MSEGVSVNPSNDMHQEGKKGTPLEGIGSEEVTGEHSHSHPHSHRGRSHPHSHRDHSHPNSHREHSHTHREHSHGHSHGHHSHHEGSHSSRSPDSAHRHVTPHRAHPEQSAQKDLLENSENDSKSENDIKSLSSQTSLNVISSEDSDSEGDKVSDVPEVIKVELSPQSHCPYELITTHFTFSKDVKVRMVSHSIWRCLAIMISIHEAVDVALKHRKTKPNFWDQTLGELFSKYQKGGLLKLSYSVLPRSKAASLEKHFFPIPYKDHPKTQDKQCHICGKKPGLLSLRHLWCEMCGEHVCDSESCCSSFLHGLWLDDKGSKHDKALRTCKHCTSAYQQSFHLLNSTSLEPIVSHLAPVEFVSLSLVNKHLLKNLPKDGKFLGKAAAYSMYTYFRGVPHAHDPSQVLSSSNKRQLFSISQNITPEMFPFELTLRFVDSSFINVVHLGKPHGKFKKHLVLVHQRASLASILAPVQSELKRWKWDTKAVVVLAKADSEWHRKLFPESDWEIKVEDLWSTSPPKNGFLQVEYFLVSS